MKLRSFFYALAASVLVLLLIGGGVFFWLVARSPLTLLQGKLSAPEAAMFVPQQAPVMASLLVNPDRLESLRQAVAAPQTRRRSRAEFRQLRQSLLASVGLDYQTDLQPWLGEEITFAVTTLDIDRQSDNGRQPGYLLGLSIRDPEQGRVFLQRFWQQQALAGRRLASEQYQGVELTHASPMPDVKQSINSSQSINPDKLGSSLKTSLATAKVGDRFILFANHPKVLRQAINIVQAPNLGLASTNQYQKALTNLQQGRIGFTFVNLPELLAWNSPAVDTAPQNKAKRNSSRSPVPVSSRPLLPQTTIPTYDSLAVGLGLNRQGLLAETALITTTGENANLETKSAAPLISHPVQALQYLPANISLAAAGVALDQLWPQVSGEFTGYDLITRLVNQPLEDFKTRWGLNLPQDIFAWVKGEYAVGLVLRSPALPDSGASRSNWLFVAERTEPETVQSAMQHLDTLAKQQGLGVGPLVLKEQEIVTWTQLMTAATAPPIPGFNSAALQAQVMGAHTEAGNYEILANSLEAANQALQAPQNSLANSDAFQAAIAPLPQPNNGYLYLDWAASRPLLEQQFPLLRAVEVVGQPLFSRLRSLTLSSYGREAGVYRSKIFIRLGSG